MNKKLLSILSVSFFCFNLLDGKNIAIGTMDCKVDNKENKKGENDDRMFCKIVDIIVQNVLMEAKTVSYVSDKLRTMYYHIHCNPEKNGTVCYKYGWKISQDCTSFCEQAESKLVEAVLNALKLLETEEIGGIRFGEKLPLLFVAV